MEELRSSTESSVRWDSEQDSLQGDEKYRVGGNNILGKGIKANHADPSLKFT